MNRRILICGLPGSGKTENAALLVRRLGGVHYDGDAVRKSFGDWDFSDTGRLRQAERMRSLCDQHQGLTFASFVCPTAAARDVFDPHLTIFMDTLAGSRHPDTDAIFETPTGAVVRVGRGEPLPVDPIANMIPQSVMIGRYQPWHVGHRALFLESLKRSGYVNIQIRQMPQGPKNPFSPFQVYGLVDADLRRHYRGCYRISYAPNVEAVHYGRDVGYAVEKIPLPPDIEAISGTAIRGA